MPAILNPGSLACPIDANTRARFAGVEKFARIVGYQARLVLSPDRNNPDREQVRVICVPEHGPYVEFDDVEQARRTFERMACIRLCGGDADDMLGAYPEPGGRAVAAAEVLVQQWRDSFPALTSFSEEVREIVKEMQRNDKVPEENRHLPRRIINLQDD